MVKTGWIEDPEDVAPAMPQTEMLLKRREQQAGVLETMLARAAADDARAARDAAASAPDPDEYAANLVARGYSPGLLSQLSQRLADVEAEAAAEEDKLAKTAKRAERMARDHAAGRIGVVDIARMQAAAIDEGDPAKVQRLQRRAESLRRQIAEASALVVPPARRDPDPVEAAVSEARELLAEAGLAPTARSMRAAERVLEQRRAEDAAAARGRAQLAAERKGFLASRPFAPGRCRDCADAGATPSEAAQIHAEMSRAEHADPGSYHAGGFYDATEIVRGTESAILSVR